MRNEKHDIHNMNSRSLKTIVAMLMMIAAGTTTVWGQNPSSCDITVAVDNTSAYTPTQIQNGSFNETPWMSYVLNGHLYDSYGNRYGNGAWTPIDYSIPNGTNQGWNTSETHIQGGTLFESGGGKAEMNAVNSAVLYQDLFTHGGDVIRWRLGHRARGDYGDEQQDMRVEVGAPNYNGDNIVYPHGVNDNIQTEINSATKVIYRSTGAEEVGSAHGYIGDDKVNLSVNRYSQNSEWYYVSGIYVVPENQPVTRFGFVSEDTEHPDGGNHLTDISFSTLIGDVSATNNSADNSVIISGYWGDTDVSKKLVVEVGSQTFNVDMSGVIGQNFTITIPYGCVGDSLTFYHEDYPSAARKIGVNSSITATAEDVNAVYDGVTAYGIAEPNVTVPANGFTIKYGTTYGGCSSSSSPTYINAGTYTVYYQVSADHYSTLIGSATVSIAKAASSVVTAPTPGEDMEYHNSNINLLTAVGTADGGNMVYALGTDANTAPTSGYSTNIPKGKAWGNYYVWYKVQGDANHNDSDPGVVVASIAEPPTYAVTVSVREAGLGTVGINNNYNVSSTSIHAHDNVNINATPASGLSFVRWTDGNGVQKSTSNNYTATITEAVDFVADFGYRVSVNKTGNGSMKIDYKDVMNVSQTTGQVTSNTQCYTHSGSEVTLTATPDAHYHFKYWTNTLNDQKVTTNPLTFTPSATVTYNAVFAVDTHSVTVAANDPTIGNVLIKQDVLTEGFESGSIPEGWTSNYYEWTVVSPANGQMGTYCIKSGNYQIDESISTLTAIVNFVGEGSISFRYRINSESCCDKGCFFIDGNKKMNEQGGSVNWTTVTYDVTAGSHSFEWKYSKDVSVSNGDDAFFVDDIVIKDFATASIDPYSYTYGQTCDILAVPEEYCYLINWTDENNNEAGTDFSKSFAVTGNTNLTANFAINSYTIIALANPTVGGSITGAGDYNQNATCTLTATANEGYTFVNWTEGETEVSTSAEYSFTVTSARVLTANFQLNSYTIAASANPTAGGTVAGAGTYDHFQNCTLTATANEGYTFVNWTKGGTQVSTSPSYSFTVAEAGDYVANFQLNSYEIAATATPTAGGSITGASDYNHFASCTLTATPATDYHFVHWTKEGVTEPVSTAATYIFTVTEDATYTATFAIDEYRIDSIPTSWRVTIGGGEPIAPTDYGTEHPDSGYVMIPVNSEFVIIPSEGQKPLVSRLELISGSISYATTAVNKTTADAPFTNPLNLVGDGTVTYSMSGDNICTVNETTGLVTLNGTEGTCTITATVTDGPLYGYTPNTANFTLTVTGTE